MQLLFGDIVVVDTDQIGVVVKSWGPTMSKNPEINGTYNYDVYVRMENQIRNFHEKDVERYKVRHKYLNEEELEYQAS